MAKVTKKTKKPATLVKKVKRTSKKVTKVASAPKAKSVQSNVLWVNNTYLKLYLFVFVFSILVIMLFVLGKYIGLAKSLSLREATLYESSYLKK